jgi:ABC-type transport system substrate-binding protein
VVALRNPPTHLDPRVGTDPSSARAFDLMLNGLVTKAPNGDLVPDLATSWEVLDDGLRYRFHLRPGVRFHDGRELTAEDVVWTFGSIVDGTVVSTPTSRPATSRCSASTGPASSTPTSTS